MKYHNKWDTKEARRVLSYVLTTLNDVDDPESSPARFGNLTASYRYFSGPRQFRVVIEYINEYAQSYVVLEHLTNPLEVLEFLTLEIEDDQYLMSVRS